jgi:hypothetical protein
MRSSYIDGLYKIVEQEKQERELAKEQELASLQTMQPPIKCLEQQILELVRSLSSDQLTRPWTMDEFVMRLGGKYRDRPHPQQVGEILKRFNWERRRSYGKNSGRYWLPPPRG